MPYPKLNSLKATQLWTQQFLGLDRRPRAYDGAFSAMGNMSGDPWPLLSSRKKRGLVAELNNPQGMLALGKLAWIDGQTLYYGGAPTPVNQLSLDAEMLPKRMVAMGAYLLIFPDGCYYNTANPGDYGTLSRMYETQPGDEIRFSLCALDGTPYSAQAVTPSPLAPDNPESGDYWLDTSGDVHTLYQWHDEWVALSSVYVKISAPGIGAGLSEQDCVCLSGVRPGEGSQALAAQAQALCGVHPVAALGDDYLIIPGIIDQAFTQTSPLRADRRLPPMDYVIECGNRLWGCRYGESDGEMVNRLYACALGDFKNWEKFQGTSQDSYYVNLGSDGPFTGAVVHRGSPCFFKAACVHKVYGEKPSNFQTQATLCEGVRPGCADTLAACNGTLYYLGATGVQGFESLPACLSKPLGEEPLLSGAGGAAGGTYYLSAQDARGAWHLYALDLERGLWHRQDGSHVLRFAAMDGEMYMLLANGLIYALGGSLGVPEEDVTWFAETAPMGYETPEHQSIRRLLLRMRLDADAECAVSIQYDSDGIWRPKGVIRGKDRVKVYLLPIVPRRCEHLQIRLEGHGAMRLYGLARHLTAAEA